MNRPAAVVLRGARLVALCLLTGTALASPPAKPDKAAPAGKSVTAGKSGQPGESANGKRVAAPLGPITVNPVPSLVLRRVSAEQHPLCLAMAIVKLTGRPEYTFACRRDAQPVRMDERSLFEIGSATKVFTGVLLAEMVQRGEVKLDDPLQKYLPASVTVPREEQREITLLDLATHTSGLPRLFPGFAPADARNPYADLTEAGVLAGLAQTTLETPIGTRYNYSNFGFMLLSYALSRAAGKDFEVLLRERVLLPLGMQTTRITLDEQQRADLVAGTDPGSRMGTRWDFPPLFAGVGGLKSSPADLALFLRAAMQPDSTPLGAALRMAMAEHRQSPRAPAMGLGWHHQRNGKSMIVHHAGQTGGYHAFLALRAETATAVAVLLNADTSLDDLGLHLLDDTYAVIEPREQLPIDDAAIAEYVGDYELRPGSVLTLKGGGGRIFAQLTGQSSLEIFSKAKDVFFYRVVAAELSFQRDPAGAIVSLTLHQNGQNQPAKKLP